MTFIGKLFVTFNLVLSLILATAAFAAYSSGIDWSDNPKTADRPEGKLVALKSEITELGKQIALANDSWLSARDELLDREQARANRRPAYQQALANLRNSKAPVQMIGPARPDGQLNFVPAEEAPGVPLRGEAYYVEEVGKLQKENEAIRKDLEAKIQENVDLTNQLVGSQDGKVKGLRQLLVEEREKNLGIVSEAEITDAMRINALVESILINKRQESITESIEQLEKYLKLKHGIDSTKN